jgi:hypothetical protein
MLSRSLITVIALAGTLAFVEGFSYWWMHPSTSDADQPKLVYTPPQPSEGKAPNPASVGSMGEGGENEVVTLLPDVVEKTMETLYCSSGTVAKIERVNGVVMHVAFFEWNSADATNVLEAFKHLPDECMGSIGMKLLSKMPPQSYQVENEQLLFDHTMFRDPVGQIIHAFKGTWVSGATKVIGKDFRGGADQWRQIRLKAALHRFNPSYARVAQGAVRGIADPQLAWQAFEEGMLKNLHME